MNQLDNDDFAAKAPYLTEIAQLKALIDKFQYALEHIVCEPDKAAFIAHEVLHNSPKQSLKEYRNEVIEEVAKHFDFRFYCDANEQRRMAEDEIRAMKDVE